MADRYASLKQGLVGCWIPSISGSGLLLPDLSGRGNNGALTNMDASDWVSGQYGRALDFDGSNDFVSMSALPLTGNPAFTIHAWVRTTDASLAQTIFLTGNESVALGAIGLVIGTRGTGTAGVEFAGLTHYAVNGIVANTIHHIAAVKIPGPINTTTQVYIDGTLCSVTGTPTTSTPNIGSARATIGQFGLPANGWRFSGQIWQVTAHNRAMSASEIRLLASEPGIGFKPAKKLSRFSQRFTYKPPKAKVFEGVRVRDHDYASLRQGLVGAWCPSLPYGGSGNTLPDVSGRGNHGTLTNMGPEDWVSGQYGRALDFDGSDDFVSMSALPLTGNPAFTIEAWIRTTDATIGQTVFLSGDESVGLGAIGLCIGVRGSGTVGFEFAGNTHYAVSGIVANTIHHVAAVKTPGPINTTSQVYIDGSLRAVTGTPTTSTPNIGSARATIGQFGLPANGLRFSGQIWQVTAHNRAMSASEIRLLASRPGIGLQPSPTRLIAREKKTGLRRKILTGQT